MTIHEKIMSILNITYKHTLSFNKGYFILRHQYYWTPKQTPEDFFANTIKKLNEAQLKIIDISYGDSKYNYYWMKFKAELI